MNAARSITMADLDNWVEEFGDAGAVAHFEMPNVRATVIERDELAAALRALEEAVGKMATAELMEASAPIKDRYRERLANANSAARAALRKSGIE